jgi:hypothetical protein
VGTFSGALDTDLVDSSVNWYVISDSFRSAAPPDDHCAFGDPFTSDASNQAYYWHDNDPTYEASNLTGVKLFVASGNGTPTAADTHTNPTVRKVEGLIEVVVDDMSHHFVAAVRRAGLGANLTTDFYGDGIHAWYYWQRDMKSFLRWLAPQLNKTLAPPSSFSYRTARATSAAWGWSFHFESGVSIPNVDTAEEFVYLDHVSVGGFHVAGNGTLRVTTPKGSYGGLSPHEVRVGGVARTIDANGAGQLTFTVTIGPPATRQQQVFPTSGPPANMARVEVSISAVPPRARGVSRSWLLRLGTVGLAALLTIWLWRHRRRKRLVSGRPARLLEPRAQ